MCFFRCLAVFKSVDPRRCETVCKELFSHFCSKYPVDVFSGIDFNDLPQIEDMFRINTVIYQLDENVATFIQKSRELYDETMRLKLFCTRRDTFRLLNKVSSVVLKTSNP